MNIEFKEAVTGITADQLQGFFEGWPNPPSPEMHLKLLSQSDHVVIAIDHDTNQVVGFITAISDGVLCAYIPLLEVLPAYRHQHIGRTLTEQMLQQLSNYYMIDLLCDADLQPFYDSVGMRRATGMFVRNYARQSGI